MIMAGNKLSLGDYTVILSGALCHIEWIFPDQMRREASNLVRKRLKCPRNVIQCVRSSYRSNNLFIIYLIRKRISVLKVITWKHLTLIAAGLVTST